jgi:hypothetical protein
MRGSTGAHLYCNDQGWAKVYPMRSEGDCGDTLNTAIRQYEIPELGIHSDNATAEVRDFMNAAIRQYGTPELGIHSDNATAEVGDFNGIRKSPRNDISYLARLRSLTARG